MALDCGLNTTGLAITTAQEFFVTYCIIFTFLLLFLVPFRVQLVNNLCKLLCFNIFTGIFMKIFCIWNIIIGLYWVVRQCGHSQVPMPKSKREKCELNQQPLQCALPPIDEYLVGIHTRQTLVIEDNSSLLTPVTIEEREWKETFQTTKWPEPTADTIPEGETLVIQVMPLLDTTPSENSQIQHRSMPEYILDILGTRVYQGYIDTPFQTLDGIIVKQPKRFLLAEEAK